LWASGACKGLESPFVPLAAPPLRSEVEMNVERPPIQIPVPFLKRETGLGDAVAAATQAVGVKPCAPCEARKKRLNGRVQLRPAWKA
jgi:hypothetical protein